MSRSFARGPLLSCLALAATLGLIPHASAQPSAVAPSSIAPDKPLALEDVIGFALQKNFGLQIQGYTLENAKETVNAAAAEFDPTITGGITRQGQQSAAATTRLEGTKTDTTTARLGVSDRITPTNGTISLNANVNREATNNTNTTLNPNFRSGVSLGLNQPLLRNSGRTAATATLERAKIGLTIAELNYRNNVLALIRDTENAYYNVVAAREALRIRQLTLERNQLLFEENQARRTSGVATDLDVLTAEVGTANARRAVIQQEQTVRDAEEALLNLINVPTFDVRPGPVAFDDYREGTPNFAQSYKLARETFPDTLSAGETIRQLEITLAVARRNLLPNLNFEASLGYTARPVSSGYSDVLSNLPNDHGDNWTIGLNYQLPWGRRSDKASFRTAQNNLNAQKVRVEQLEQQLMVNVRAAVRAVETNLATVDIAAKATELAARQFEQQKARFDAGLSTSRVVLQFQEDLEAARFNELSAKLALRRAVSELRRLEGTSLQRFRVQLPQ